MNSTEVTAAEASAEPSPRGAGASRILVIDDDADLRGLIAAALRDDGFEVLEAENGRVGVALATAQRPALILCDVRMPELDGFRALGELRRTPGTAHVPFVLLSGVGVTNQDVRHGMNLGADDYLVKPFTPEELRATVYARLRRHGAPSGAFDALPRETLPSDPPVEAEGLGTLDGRFRLDRRASAGGMGTIYEGTDLTDNARVAVKIAPCQDETRSARLLREADALAALHDPTIVPFRHRGRTAEGAIYLVMDWLEGRDLHQRLAESLLSLHDTLSVGRRAATALASAHRVGIVHRDVKPSNIFLRDDRPERAVLIDFGLASMPDATPLTQAGMVLGTLGYIAPEQVLRHDASDARTDVFSLGCVLFQCLTGKVPFAAPNTLAAIASVLLDDIPHVRGLAPHMLESLDALLFEMMARDPARRPADGAAVLHRLREFTA
jgi:DNA-binding response OmpR family regulator